MYVKCNFEKKMVSVCVACVCVCVMMTHTKITPEPSPVCLNAMLSEL